MDSNGRTPKAHPVALNGLSIHGWQINTRTGPIISDRDADAFRQAVGPDVKTLPEMLFSSSRVTLLHEPSGVALDFTAAGALREWQAENLPPLQVKVAKEWRAAREQEIHAQKAIQLEYDWTFTTPYSGNIVDAATCKQSMGPGDTGHYDTTSAAHTALPNQGALETTTTTAAQTAPGVSQDPQPAVLPEWQDTEEQIDRALLMERDPILFFSEVSLFESDLDDNGISQMSVKLRVMPRAWLLLLRFWLRVDGCMVRLRETRLFCRHDTPAGARVVLREQRHYEGSFEELRASGAPGDGAAYADGDAAAQVFQGVSRMPSFVGPHSLYRRQRLPDASSSS